jgi:hypothetical protein
MKLQSKISGTLLFFIILHLTLPCLHAADSPEMADEMMEDLALTNTNSQLQWHNIIPGETKAEWIRNNITGIVSETKKNDKTVFLLPPGLPFGDNKIDPPFGRVATIVCNDEGIVESIDIGGFFPDNRPDFNDLKTNLGLIFTQISETSSYSATSSVYSATNGFAWLIVSNIESSTGKREVLALRYYIKGIKDNLPLPATPHKR